MVKLAKLPTKAVIDGYKKHIDFYVHKGQPCARMWPKSPTLPRAPAVQVTINAFREAVALWNQVAPNIKTIYNDMAKPTSITGRDLFMRAYIHGYGTSFRPIEP